MSLFASKRSSAEIEDSRYGKIVIRRHFRAKYVRLSVAPSGTLSVSAPLYTPVRFIKRFIDTSNDEIDTLLAHHRVVYKDRMEIGKSHRLHVTVGPNTAVHYKKPLITVELTVQDELLSFGVQQLIKPIVVKALRIEAKAFLPRRVSYLAEANGFDYTKVKLSHAKSRWGSCSSDRTISLNIALMKLDFEVIDYVIIHELAHTRQLNHSKSFWLLVEKADPDYKLHRKELKKHSPHI